MATSAISWDWREGPDVRDLTSALRPLGIHVHQVDMGMDAFNIVFSTEPLSDDDAIYEYERHTAPPD